MYNADTHKRYYCTPKGRAYQLYHMAKSRAKNKNYTFDITREWVLERLEEGVCEATGIEFILKTEETYGKYNNAQPYSPTLDRIDNSKGYTKDNTQVVVAIYNFAKWHWGKVDVIHMAKKLLEKEETLCQI